MGFLLSTLHNAYKTMVAVVGAFVQLNADYVAVLQRASADPGLPVESATHSYWLDDPPFPELVNVQSSEFPTTADIVIIGSGITGVAIARTILQECERKGENKKIVVLEAKQLASGATGRNGGHIKAASYETFATMKKKIGAERASAIVRFQLKHLKYLTEFCQSKEIDIAECRRVETVDLFIDDKAFERARKQAEDLGHAVPEFETHFWTRDDAQKKFNATDHVIGAVSYEAGALWPYRLVVSIWKEIVTNFASNISIETGTPAVSVELSGSSQYPYNISTERGHLKCRHVVHATNAFTGHLIPGLRGKMTGMRAHMSAQRPGDLFPDGKGDCSWSIIYSNGFDYMTQRPKSSIGAGDLMIGGGFFRSDKQGLDQVGVWDDSKINALTASHLHGILPTVFQWGRDAHDGRMKKMWSGTICYTADFLPFVGRLDTRLTGRRTKAQIPRREDEPGEWISAGYQGDGMVYAWLCGTALALMITGSEKEDLPERAGIPGGALANWFPQELLVSYQRVQRANLADLVDEI